MSASSPPPSSPHHIGIIISTVGRFLQCRDCQLSFTFPDGTQFGKVAKLFEPYSCSSPIRIPDWLIENIVKDGAPGAKSSRAPLRHRAV